MTDLLGGQVDAYFASLTAAIPQVKAGKLKALAVTSATRVGSMPNVPTLAESGFPGLDYYVFYGVVASTYLRYYRFCDESGIQQGTAKPRVEGCSGRTRY